MKAAQVIFIMTFLFFLFSCSKKDEVEVSEFVFEVSSDFLTASQKGYYLLTNNEGEILSEGKIENSKKYNLTLSQKKSVHFTYILTIPDIQRTSIIANTFLNIELSNSLILHQALNSGSALENIAQPKGQSKVGINCFGGTHYTTIATQSNAVFSLQDRVYPQYLTLFGAEEEALAIRNTEYNPTSSSQFEYAIKNINIDQENTFVCSDFNDGKDVMKSIQIDVGRTHNIGKGDIILSALPNGFLSPNPIHSFGQIDKRNIDFTASQISTLWYMEDWIKSKREYMSITSQTYERTSDNTVKKIYAQFNYGLYPPPATLRLETPITSIDVVHNQNKSSITQEGEQSLGGVLYQKKDTRFTDEKIYVWLVQFSGEEQNIEWVFPKNSEQMLSHLGIVDVFEKEMIPVSKFMSLYEDYTSYETYIKNTFKPYNFRLYEATQNWKTNYDITEYILNQGEVSVIYDIKDSIIKMK